MKNLRPESAVEAVVLAGCGEIRRAAVGEDLNPDESGGHVDQGADRTIIETLLADVARAQPSRLARRLARADDVDSACYACGGLD